MGQLEPLNKSLSLNKAHIMCFVLVLPVVYEKVMKFYLNEKHHNNTQMLDSFILMCRRPIYINKLFICCELQLKHAHFYGTLFILK